jgi:hypothetical protein
MQVIDVRRRNEGVQRSVDGGGHAIVTEGRQGIKPHHFVFECLAPIACLQLVEPVEIEQRETGIGNRSQIASATLHREHARGFAREGIS